MGISIGPLFTRRSIFIDATPARVWEEFTTKERLVAWFGTGHEIVEYEPKVGGKVDIDIGHVGEALGRKINQRIHCVGTVLVFENEREVTFETVWQPSERSISLLWTLRITPLYDGSLVQIIHHGYERLGTAAADALQGNEQGWDAHHLVALRQIVDDR